MKIKRFGKEVRNRLIVLGKPIGALIIATGFLLIMLSWLNVYETDATGLGLLLGLISCGLGWIALSVAYSSGAYEERMLEFIHGEISEQFSAEFDLARIVNEIQLTETGKEFTIYDSSKNIGMRDVPFYFGNAWIGLENMRGKDILLIRIYIKEGETIYQVSKDEEHTYKGNQLRPARIDSGFYNQDGIKITAKHLEAESSPLDVSCYVYDAARGS